MSWFTRAFIKASLAWLAASVTLGLAVVLHPEWAAIGPAAAVAGLLGFVSMMLFGLMYHLLPRMAGRPLESDTVAEAHWWLANVGLVLIVFGMLLEPLHLDLSSATVLVGTGLSAVGGYSFVVNLWRTFTPTEAPTEHEDEGHEPIHAARRVIARLSILR